MSYSEAQYVIDELGTKIDAAGIGIPPANMRSLTAQAGDEKVTLKFQEPADTVVDGQLICTVKGCKIVMKQGAAPESLTDGEVVAETGGDSEHPLGSYVSTGIEVTNLENDEEYFFRAFCYSDHGVYNVAAAAANIKSATPKAYTLYGYRINKADSNPATRIEYTDMAVGFTPAKMDFTNGQFNYGSWANAWFVTGNKPAMVKADGTVDYYLGADDQTKKEDGTSSDVANQNYNGNAMALFPIIYFKRYEEDGYEYCKFCDIKLDDSYEAYAHKRADGTYMDWFAWGMFKSTVVSNKARSLSGKAIGVSATAANEITYAEANGSGWYTTAWAEVCYIRDVLTLLGRNDNAQATFGYGRGGASAAANTGSLVNKGRFFGYSSAQSTTNSVKVMYIEDFWGNVWDRVAGLVNDNGTIKVKMQRPYNTTGSGYTSTGLTPSGTSGGYINADKMTAYGRIPYTASGSETTYACDGLWFNNSQNDYALFGGNWSHAGLLGFSYVSLGAAASYTGTSIGARLSLQQPQTA